MKKQFRPPEIIKFAVRIEENGINFYKEMAKKMEEKSTKELFNFLSDQEIKHKDIFQDFLSSIEGFKPDESYTEEYFSYLKAYADDNIFSKEKKGRMMASEINTPEEAIDVGIGIEKDSIHYYLELEKLVPEDKKKIIQKVIEEERKHYLKFRKLKNLMGK